MQIEIRQEQPADRSEVYELNRAAFGQDNEARLVDLLRESKAFIPELSVVATAAGAVVGHILFTKISIVDDEGCEFESLALAPMAVKPALQRQGIGGQLVKYGLGKAKALGSSSMIVLSHEG
ncbi:GNAT family N-acetyltransferase [Pontibacter anaerobius]|uniref:N-acetyltransferase n=1 Tax=Pontibacter anaerobius TaxID=2993940 RepID=A0ABT3RJT5_9BACT|nr:N-acetyltransferase [Pontibacter anaerobius]MCX2742070.1 N-acetyltransferase [Pontibacter anaerobius]